MGLHGRQGTFAEYVSVPDALLFRLPGNVSPIRAVAGLHSGLTAVIGLDYKVRLKKGEVIFVHGGSGNVGHTVIQMARSIGAFIIASAGSKEKAEDCKAIGADEVILYREEDLGSKLREMAPNGVNVWWESTPTPILNQAIQCMAHSGRIVVISGYQHHCGILLGDFYTRNLTLFGYAVSFLEDEVIQKAATRINQALEKNIINPRIACILPLEHARIAHHKLESENVYGKIVLTLTSQIS